MRNFYVLFAMLFSAAAVSAQALPSSETVEFGSTVKKVVPVQNLKTVYNNNWAGTKAPAEDPQFAVYVVNGDGVYSSGLTSNFTSTEASFALAPMGVYSWFDNYAKVVDGVTYEWTYSDGVNSYQMEPESDNSAAKMISTVTTYYPELKGTAGSTTLTFKKSEYATGSDGNPSKNNCFLTPAKGRSMIAMADPGFCQLFYGTMAMDEARTDIRGFGDLKIQNVQTTKIFELFNKTVVDMVVYGANMILMETATPTTGKDITFEIWEYDATQSDPFVNKLGSTTANTTNLKALSNGLHAIEFEFVSNAAGFPVATPVIIPAGRQFAIVLTGFEGTNLISVLNSANGFTGSAYYILEDGTTGTAGYGNAPEIPSVHLALTLDATLPSAAWGFSTMNAPVMGGDVTVSYEGEEYLGNVVYTSDKFDDEELIELTYPEWIKDVVVTENKYDETNGWDVTGSYTVTCKADALPSDVNGRQGFIEVRSTVTEKVLARTEVGQGEWTPTGVESVEVAKAKVAVAGDNFQLTYGEEFNKVTVYNVAGSVVASYVLPQGGSFEVPAAGLNGVYVLVFEGASREVVKVVK